MGNRFGTDGIRGQVGSPPLTPEGIVQLGGAMASWLKGQPIVAPGDSGRHLVLVGGDTRSSTSWIMDLLAGTLSAHGVDVCPLHVATTPQLAFETAGSRASAGIVVTASHNPSSDNGVKIFGHDGFKLSGEDQCAIEALMQQGGDFQLPEAFGVVDDTLIQRGYIEHLRNIGTGKLSGFKLVVDAAHGAASFSARNVFEATGAEVTFIGTDPDGININDGVGATHPDMLAAKVVETGAYAGVALDGDADRLIMVDEAGKVVDGDQLLALLATSMQAEGRLKGGGVVTTVMSNLGLERHLSALGLSMPRTKVGDKHVVAALREDGFNLGGEQSGHIVMLDAGTTGDGLLAALHVLSPRRRTDARFRRFPRCSSLCRRNW
ncbi:MAG: phosphoglucosamine mutase [Pseudomonadota bacterium]